MQGATGSGVRYPRNYCQNQEGQGDWQQPSRIYQEQVFLDNLISFYHEILGSVDESRCLS